MLFESFIFLVDFATCLSREIVPITEVKRNKILLRHCVTKEPQELSDPEAYEVQVKIESKHYFYGDSESIVRKEGY